MTAPTVVSRDADPPLGDQLASREYLRGRQQPRRRDGDYLILRDVQEVVTRCASNARGAVFDYGCGGSPYALCFAGCDSYVGADVCAGPHVDRVLEPNGLTREPDQSYDWVLSTQVLEHVAEPELYLRECHRLLRPGGQLILTTHGLFPEHGCPYDFHRWTAEGLKRAVEAGGFEILADGKVTAGVRGAIQLMHHCVWSLRAEPRRRIWRLFLGGVRKFYGWVGVPLLNAVADQFPEHRIMPSNVESAVYIGVFVHARRPA